MVLWGVGEIKRLFSFFPNVFGSRSFKHTFTAINHTGLHRESNPDVEPLLTTDCGSISRVGVCVYRLSQAISKCGAVSGALYQSLNVHSDNFYEYRDPVVQKCKDYICSWHFCTFSN